MREESCTQGVICDKVFGCVRMLAAKGCMGVR